MPLAFFKLKTFLIQSVTIQLHFHLYNKAIVF